MSNGDVSFIASSKRKTYLDQHHQFWDDAKRITNFQVNLKRKPATWSNNNKIPSEQNLLSDLKI